jgi:hypothetical protein
LEVLSVSDAGDQAEERPPTALGLWSGLDGLGRPVVGGNTLELPRAGLEDLLSDVRMIHGIMY